MSQNHSESRLGRALRQGRRQARVTQAGLAERAECSVRSVWQAEHGLGHTAVFLRLLDKLGLAIAGRALPPGPHLGGQLQALRRRLGVSARAAAATAGLSPNTVAAIEGNRHGHLAAIERLAEALGARLTLVRQGEARGFFAAVAVSSACQTWETPPDLLARLYEVLGTDFDLDPCSPGRLRSRVRAPRHFTVDDNGLAQDWTGRVFMNPPYGRGIRAWTAKARREVEAGRAEFVIGLVPARTDTRWWHADIARKADTWLFQGRLRFGDGTAPAPFPSALVLWGGPPWLRASLSQAFPDDQHVQAAAAPGGRPEPLPPAGGDAPQPAA